jgi:lipocalin-like protein
VFRDLVDRQREKSMNRYSTRIVAVASFLLLALAIRSGDTVAQSMNSVAGTYTPVSIPAYGDNPRGQMILTSQGTYSIVITRTALQKIASGSRVKGTAEENKAVVEGSIGHVGTYTIDDGGKAITFHIETSTFSNWNGTTQKRALKVKDDQLTYTVSTPSAGGPGNDVTRKRLK